MVIRNYKSEDLPQMVTLFRETIIATCAKEYTLSQRKAWAGADVSCWDESFRKHKTLVAEEEGEIIGFADMDEGYLDRLYVHKDFQGRGVASALCDRLESESGADVLSVYASLTARKFFEKRGYVVIRENTVVRAGTELKNYYMEKPVGQKRREI